MKTLLLTLVVVTIVCLDFGHTLLCYTHMSNSDETTECCQNGMTTCYNKIWSDFRGTVIERGCGCPKTEYRVKITCCQTDKCNR
uniref:Putative three finger toxin n=1 Tax=Micrurus altirostris TaxID=129457 RepID=F5CPE1_MICAT|nr:putative three finger toxin precursor [Micrurus altirostris]